MVIPTCSGLGRYFPFVEKYNFKQQQQIIKNQKLCANVMKLNNYSVSPVLKSPVSYPHPRNFSRQKCGNFCQNHFDIKYII